MKVSLVFLSSQYEDIAKSMKDLQEKNKKLQVENFSLRSQILTMTNDINQQKKALNDYEQYSRQDCLEFSGIPKPAWKDINAIIIDIAEVVGFDITKDDISVSHRLQRNKHNPDTPSTIIAKFVRRETKKSSTEQGNFCGIRPTMIRVF